MSDSTFADRLKEARSRARFTQGEVAEKVEVHRFTYAKWEQGLHPPGAPKMFTRLAKVLDCNLVWLRDGIGDGPGRYVPEPDSVSRRHPTRRPRARVSVELATGSGKSRAIDWHQIVLCLQLLQEVSPSADADDLAPALGLFYTLSTQSPANYSREVAEQILQAVV